MRNKEWLNKGMSLKVFSAIKKHGRHEEDRMGSGYCQGCMCHVMHRTVQIQSGRCFDWTSSSFKKLLGYYFSSKHSLLETQSCTKNEVNKTKHKECEKPVYATHCVWISLYSMGSSPGYFSLCYTREPLQFCITHDLVTEGASVSLFPAFPNGESVRLHLT